MSGWTTNLCKCNNIKSVNEEYCRLCKVEAYTKELKKQNTRLIKRLVKLEDNFKFHVPNLYKEADK